MQTLRRERRQKFTAILSAFSDKLSQAEIEATAELLSDAAMSRSELATEAEFDKPNIYRIYEENIGVIIPLIADELNDIDTSYPEGWFLDACKEAVKMNIRNLKYVRAILENRKSGKVKPDDKQSEYETL